MSVIRKKITKFNVEKILQNCSTNIRALTRTSKIIQMHHHPGLSSQSERYRTNCSNQCACEATTAMKPCPSQSNVWIEETGIHGQTRRDTSWRGKNQINQQVNSVADQHQILHVIHQNFEIKYLPVFFTSHRYKGTSLPNPNKVLSSSLPSQCDFPASLSRLGRVPPSTFTPDLFAHFAFY